MVQVTEDHKAAMAEGRVQSKAVREYLEALEQHKPKRGRRITPESLRQRLATVEAHLSNGAAEKPLERLQLIQEKMDLEERLEQATGGVDLTALEAGFVEVAASYGERKGISFAAWRAVGVAPAVLKEAGIKR